VSCLETWLQQKGSTKCELCGFELSTRRAPLSVAAWFLDNIPSGRSPSNVQQRKCFLYDMLCLILLLPLTVASVMLCIEGATDYSRQAEETRLRDLAMNRTTVVVAGVRRAASTKELDPSEGTAISAHPVWMPEPPPVPEWQIERNISRCLFGLAATLGVLFLIWFGLVFRDHARHIQRWRVAHAQLTLVLDDGGTSGVNASPASSGGSFQSVSLDSVDLRRFDHPVRDPAGGLTSKC